MSSSANQYIRNVLHHTEPPPPINARFFYSSPIPIDDHLAPLPPYTSASNATLKQEPKPFSTYDNTALDKAWNELRRKILHYNEAQGEKDAAERRNESRTRPRASSSVVRERERRQASSSREVTPRTRTGKAAASSSLGQGDGFPQEESLNEASKALAGATELSASPDTTGTPFIRAPSRKKLDPSPLQRVDERSSRPEIWKHDTYQWDDDSHLADRSPAPEPKQSKTTPTAKVAVGVSRLHQVEMPDLQMTPIYWAPVNDTAQVIRGTWFYQDTMLPVETYVANMLEAGYVDLQCWTETWKDELDSAVEVGAAGEAKIVHKLWPEKTPMKPTDSRPPSRQASVNVGEDNLVRAAAANLFIGQPETAEQQRERAVEAATDIIDISTGPGGSDNKAVGVSTWGRAGAVRTYATCGIIYANDREAKILKPTLMPSAYYGRRPLANYTRKGHKIGIPVVRGFDQAIWDKLHPPKAGVKKSQGQHGISTSGPNAKKRAQTDPELASSERPVVSELVLVIHGIGQKLSERMESFNFTHAINDFRREIMVECGNKEVKTHFREDMGGIMTLPVNWRHQLSFEEGGYRNDDDPSGAQPDSSTSFTLQDITPDTLPSVRGIVSDVMLDIPYYMSQHQPKMIAAVIREANKVYQLWCQNNPGFAEHGRVHIIAHSLGSVMAIDILSKQPTQIPQHLPNPTNLNLAEDDLDHLLFNTHNLFLAGSPAGFFLLLRRAQLRPRIDHPSTQALFDPAATNNSTICGQQGEYGCIAVHNIYNIMNGYDPVAYQMNATVDVALANSLKKAVIPSNIPDYWFSSGTSNTARWFSGRRPNTSTTTNPPNLSRLPSNVELEIHNFTQEEITEQRMLLLNDNGQIDFSVRYGGGVFEIQYLTMLGAHSSYWGLRDFIRFVVVEVGRRGGSEGGMLGLRAVRKRGGGGKGV